MFESIETTPHTHGLTPPLDAVAWRVRLRTGESTPRTLQCVLRARTGAEAIAAAINTYFPDGDPGYALRARASVIERGDEKFL